MAAKKKEEKRLEEEELQRLKDTLLELKFSKPDDKVVKTNALRLFIQKNSETAETADGRKEELYAAAKSIIREAVASGAVLRGAD